MKSTLKKTCLLWLSLLLVFSVVWIIGVTNAVNWQNVTTIETNPSSSNLHWPSLFSLYLGDQESWLNVTSEDFLSVLNWLIIWNSHSTNNSQLVVIGWWSNNSVSASNAWIGWWYNNSVSLSASNAWIGWWKSNNVAWNAWVVVWWVGNKAGENGVVVWWYNNNYDNKWVVLWWQNNKAGVNSLVLWQSANWANNSFSWNWGANQDTARIEASNWVLIWTYEAKPWIALVVNWAVKLWDGQNPTEQWEINIDEDWCVRVRDKNGWSIHVLGKTSESQCNAGRWCQFGKTKLQDGETISQNGNGLRDVKAYAKPYGENCTRVSVTCNDWRLSREAYPYCYQIAWKSKNRFFHLK